MTDSIYLIDNFVQVLPGEAFRLFPFGRLVKNGRVREVTRELAAKFRLPHFRPPIKLGSHNDTTPAGGHIVALEVREDGLYAIPEFNDEGATAVKRGAFRYHSPEVIWEGGLEDPETGELITGPLIVGDALLHTPHLGEQAALYSIDIYGGDDMSESVSVPVSLWERILPQLFSSKEEAMPAEQPAPQPEREQPQDNFAAEQYAALQAERDDLAAKVATMEAAAIRSAQVAHYATELDATALAEDGEMHELLADLPEEKATLILQRFKALSAQIKESNLTADLGNSGGNDNDDPAAALNAAVQAKMAEAKIDYASAFRLVRDEQPDLFNAYAGGK